MGLNDNDTFSLMFLFFLCFYLELGKVHTTYKYIIVSFLLYSTIQQVLIAYPLWFPGWNYNCPCFPPSEEYRHIEILGQYDECDNKEKTQSIRAIKLVLVGAVIRKESLGRVTFSKIRSKKSGGKSYSIGKKETLHPKGLR